MLQNIGLSRVFSLASLVTLAVATLTTASTFLVVVTSLPQGFMSLVRSLFPFLAVRSHRPPWGRIVEERTNLPVAGAVVTVLDASGKPRETMSSRNDGTFGTLLPPGAYRLSVRHPDFTFADAPAHVVVFPDERVYTGGLFTVEDEEWAVSATHLVIGMKPTRARRSTLRERLHPFLERLRVVQARLAIPVLLFGSAVNSIALGMEPTPLLVSGEILYGVFLTFELLLSRVFRRALGSVRDAVAKSPVSLAIVRLMDVQTRRLVATKVTSPRGDFLLMPPPGRYRLQVIHHAFLPYTSDALRIRRGGTSIVPLKVDLAPVPGTGGTTDGARL